MSLESEQKVYLSFEHSVSDRLGRIEGLLGRLVEHERETNKNRIEVAHRMAQTEKTLEHVLEKLPVVEANEIDTAKLVTEKKTKDADKENDRARMAFFVSVFAVFVSLAGLIYNFSK